MPSFSQAELLAARKLERLKNDPRYAIENLYSVLDLEKSARVPFRFNEAQVRLQEEINWFRSRRLPVRLWILKARRAGISTGVEANIYHDTTFNPNRVSIILANHSKPAKNIFKMCIGFWKSTPKEWRPPLPAKYRGEPPEDKFEFEDRESYLYIATARSLEQYLGSGCNNLHATEVARYPEAEEIFLSVFPTLAKSATNSMFFGESTPRGQGNYFHRACMSAYESRGEVELDNGVFRLLFIPWHEMRKSFAIPFESMEQRHKFELSLTADDKDLKKLYGVSLEQLKWWRQTKNSPPFNEHPELLDQEYPSDITTAFMSTGVSVFGRKDIKRLTYEQRKPLWVGDIYWGENDSSNSIENDHDLVRRPIVLSAGEARANGFGARSWSSPYRALRVYRWPEKGDRIAIGADIGEGNPETRDGDDSTIQVVCYHDFEPHEQLMVWQGKCNPVLFAVIASALAWYVRYKTGDDPPPLLAPEWTGPGVTTTTYLDNKSLYVPTFRYFNAAVHKQPKTHHIGWESNYRNKKLMVHFLRYLVERNEIEIPDAATVLQMSAFRQFGRDGDGDEEWGGEGMHDDLVSSLAIATALFKLGRVGSSVEGAIDMLAPAGFRDEDQEAFDPSDERIVSGAGEQFDYEVPPGFEESFEDEPEEVMSW